MKHNLVVALLLYLLAVPLVESYSKPSQQWENGLVVLADGTTLKGEIRYDWRSNGVRFRDINNRQRAYSVQQLQRFSYFDREESRIRQFTVVDFPVNAVLTRPVFLEEILSGSLVVYRRPYNHRKPTPVTSFARYVLGSWLTSDHEGYDYFVYTNQAFTKLEQFSQQFWPQLQKETPETVWSYVTANHRISPATLTGQLRLIARYNEMPHTLEPHVAE